jgi:hypothetical protein
LLFCTTYILFTATSSQVTSPLIKSIVGVSIWSTMDCHDHWRSEDACACVSHEMMYPFAEHLVTAVWMVCTTFISGWLWLHLNFSNL